MTASTHEMMPPDFIEHGEAIRVSIPDHLVSREACHVVVEHPLTLTIEGVGSYTLMCTPNDPVPLAVGFAFSEGIITSIRDIDILYHCEDDPSAILMRLGRSPASVPDRNMLVASSCGMCGSMNIDDTLAALPRVGNTLHIAAPLLLDVMDRMKAQQQIFAHTGGTHAAAIFAPNGEILACAEDLGRHNALDKCIGKCCLTEQSMTGCGAVLSGRVSLEMVTKAARAGLELIGAVSAPSSLAVAAADHCRMSLCCFVRGDRMTIYSHAARIEETQDLSHT